MSENARLAMDVLQTDLRNAGFVGCRPLLNDAPMIVLLAGDGGFLSTGPGLRGYRGTGTGFAPALTGPLAALPAASAPLAEQRRHLGARAGRHGRPRPRRRDGRARSRRRRSAASSPANTLAAGDIVLIASCKASTMFQVTEANPAATGVLTHAIGGGFAPGNATDDLQQRFRSDATVYRMETRHYYVAPSVIRPGTNSLWRLVVPGHGRNPDEMASGSRPPARHLRRRRRGRGGPAERRPLRRRRRRQRLGQGRLGAPADAGRDRQGRRRAQRRRASTSPAARSPSPTAACAPR